MSTVDEPILDISVAKFCRTSGMMSKATCELCWFKKAIGSDLQMLYLIQCVS